MATKKKVVATTEKRKYSYMYFHHDPCNGLDTDTAYRGTCKFSTDDEVIKHLCTRTMSPDSYTRHLHLWDFLHLVDMTKQKVIFSGYLDEFENDTISFHRIIKLVKKYDTYKPEEEDED